ncbi:hypothetical protein HMPREF0742_02478 [Rothia aeria F0184]|uniref:Uncharacterized protein n=1 Tax=Rothia aeria F0184 TaxID=888019 RepID=U7UX04_9MICC|nr:hypothetical protein HMPREF0742_02478 [Rothia aeria F0184]
MTPEPCGIAFTVRVKRVRHLLRLLCEALGLITFCAAGAVSYRQFNVFVLAPVLVQCRLWLVILPSIR